MTRHRCCVPGLTPGGPVELPEGEAHHVRSVLRLAVGAELRVFDGRGREWMARVLTVDRRRVELELLEPLTAIVEPPVAVTLAIGLLKGDQLSTVVRDATALGATTIVPFVSSHVALPAAAGRVRLVERLTRIATSSAAQCGRAVVPAVEAVTTFDRVIAQDAEVRVICVEPAAATTAADRPTARPATATLLVGPEGGWSAAELATALERGAVPLSLGPRTLRAETAPVVALSVLWDRWGWS